MGHGTRCGAAKPNRCSLRLESLSLAASQKEPTASPAPRDSPAELPVCPVLPVPRQWDGPAQWAEAGPGAQGAPLGQFALQVWGGGALQGWEQPQGPG